MFTFTFILLLIVQCPNGGSNFRFKFHRTRVIMGGCRNLGGTIDVVHPNPRYV